MRLPAAFVRSWGDAAGSRMYSTVSGVGAAVTYAAATVTVFLVPITNECGSFLPRAQFQLKNGSTLLMLFSFSSNDSRPVFFQ
jgi:hypothetical protein